MEKYVKTSVVLMIGVYCILLGLFAESVAAEQEFKVIRRARTWLTLEKQIGFWKATSPNITMKVMSTPDEYLLETPTTKYTAKFKGEKIKVYDAAETLRFVIKNTGDKIKVLQSEEDLNPWSLSVKDDGARYKVSKGEQEIGKVKWYADTSKVKVKDLDEEEVCVIRSDVMVPGAAVCLFDDLSEEDELLLFTLLSLLTLE